MRLFASTGFVSEYSDGRKNNYDFIRVVAASLVILSHSFPLTGSGEDPLSAFSRGQATFGGLAVQIFFVVSGFLITQSFDRSKSAFKFLRARLLRIFPGLTVVVLLTVFVLGPSLTSLSKDLYFKSGTTWSYFWNILLWTRYELPGVFAGNPYPGVVNGSLWTLSYEFFCYFIVLILGVLSLLRRRWLVAAVWLASYVLHLAAAGLETGGLAFITLGTVKLFRFFGAGMVLYVFRDKVPIVPSLGLASVIAMIGACVLPGAVAFVFPICLSYAILCLAYSGRVRLYDFAKRGDMSFGIYIYAFPVQQAVQQFMPGGFALNFLVALPITAILAFASWHAVEKPCMRLKNGIRALFPSRGETGP